MKLWEVLKDMKEGDRYQYGTAGGIAYVTPNNVLCWVDLGHVVETIYSEDAWIKLPPKEEWVGCSERQAKLRLLDDEQVQAWRYAKDGQWEDVRHEIVWTCDDLRVLTEPNRKWRFKKPGS